MQVKYGSFGCTFVWIILLNNCGDETIILSNNSAQPDWRLNYRGDYRGEVKPISTRDLLTWSFQVARGMEYLASRKVLHGDLAARNILLADNNVVKICDFGLAKTMYNDNNYKKSGNSLLPIKWMAIESIRDRIFSTQSDIWSFGIVLWELFSLARSPYPGMDADERLYQKLMEGYRMEAPKYASKDIYKIMLECWNSKPAARPSFTKLAEKIGVLLEDSVRKHYLDLNDPYLKMNTERKDESDYLAMLSPPSFDVISTPSANYINEEMFTVPLHLRSHQSRSPKADESYLYMGGNQIFSPRHQSNNAFVYPVCNRKVQLNANAHELYPIMTYSEEELGTDGYLAPITPVNSISNPMYHQMPKIEKELDLSACTSKMLNTSDNYIEIPRYRNLVDKSSRDSGICGSVSPVDLELLVKDTPQVQYVNIDSIEL